MHRLATSILCSTLLPLVLADATSYKISNVQFWQYHRSSTFIEETVILGAQGTTPGALVVHCDLTWNASAAAQVPAAGPPLVEHFNCTDTTVDVTMQRMMVDFFQPWYLTVSLKYVGSPSAPIYLLPCPLPSSLNPRTNPIKNILLTAKLRTPQQRQPRDMEPLQPRRDPSSWWKFHRLE